MEKKKEKESSPLSIKASRRGDLPYNEVHKYVKDVKFEEELVNKAREEILDAFGVPAENVAIYPEANKEKRGIRIFFILENKETGEKYYGDGHIPHAIMLEYLFQKFPQIGIKDRQEIFEDLDNFRKRWKTTKGFIDPYMNGFRDFPQTRKTIIREMNVKEQNGLSEEEVSVLKKDPDNGDIELPNWVLSV